MALTKTSLPGPAASPPGFENVPLRTGGRLPGPLDFHAIFLADVAATKAAKTAAAIPTLAMPTPYGQMTKYARVVKWPLYGDSGPQTTDISQGGLGDCPLPALLAAMANIPSGRKKIRDMITEHKEQVITDLSALRGALADEQPAGNITSQRSFTVTIGGKSIDVSDVFFTDVADSGWSLLYMQASDTASVLWACVIEKACSALLGGYDKLNEVLTV
ncbi:MAG TPA: C2 family cysteine protease, partial [Casimicrobiaceae bacterium]